MEGRLAFVQAGQAQGAEKSLKTRHPRAPYPVGVHAAEQHGRPSPHGIEHFESP
ncbi:Hypothetical protein A7982_04208 [Minicystis rosea]|nr:Hypothetical protein A7982_04208 [Minicystis rosea]